MMRLHANLLATVGEYSTDEGPVKRRIPVGAIFRDESTGAMSVRLEAVPVTPAWSGWLAVELVTDDDAAASSSRRPRVERS
ncbi:MAG TPA: hypothetical protein VE907_15655 [Gammaproteobacteria bacterium]|nr:hypothetical protein [Gammaproteobacteria bacterium]